MQQGEQVKSSVCMWCRGFCHVKVHLANGELIKIEEDPEYPIRPFPPVRGCIRAQTARENFYHPDRLSYPLKRASERGEGKWNHISWDQALDEIAESLAKIRDESGPESVASAKGTMRTCDEFRSRFFSFIWQPKYLRSRYYMLWTPNPNSRDRFLDGGPSIL